MLSFKRLGLIMLLVQGLMFTFNTSLPGQRRQLDLKWNPFFGAELILVAPSVRNFIYLGK